MSITKPGICGILEMVVLISAMTKKVERGAGNPDEYPVDRCS